MNRFFHVSFLPEQGYYCLTHLESLSISLFFSVTRFIRMLGDSEYNRARQRVGRFLVLKRTRFE